MSLSTHTLVRNVVTNVAGDAITIILEALVEDGEAKGFRVFIDGGMLSDGENIFGSTDLGDALDIVSRETRTYLAEDFQQ